MSKLVFPTKDSHKGQNGKLLIIGGSELFHAPLIWAAEVASRIVDMVHVSSPYLLNNKLMEEKLKQRFWSGIVVPWEKVDDYIEEDEVILIGPGMTRTEQTAKVTNRLLKQFSNKRWVVDGGALQKVDPTLLTTNMIITPHHKEWERLAKTITNDKEQMTNKVIVSRFSQDHEDLVILLKGRVDLVVRGDEVVEIEGGNEGMTKGGTGDVLAGLVAALATKNDLWLAAQVGSRVNKLAGDSLYGRVGSFYNASDLVKEIPYILRDITANQL